MDFFGPHFSFHGSGHGVFIINTLIFWKADPYVQNLMVYHIDLSCHAQVLNGQSRHLPFFQSFAPGAPCQYGNAEIPRTKSLMVATLSTSSMTLNSSSDTLLLSRWEIKRFRVPESGRRRIRFSFFSSFRVTMLFLESRVLIGYGQNQGICIQHDRIEIGIRNPALHNGQIDLIGFQFHIKIIYGIRNNCYAAYLR